MSTRRTAFSIEVVVESRDERPENHDKKVRWAYRNMLGTNSDMQDVYYLAVVRDEEGHLLEFSGAGRGNPSPELLQRMAELTNEKQSAE